MSEQSNTRLRDAVWPLGGGLNQPAGWALAGLGALALASIVLIAHYVYGYTLVGFFAMLLVVVVAALAMLAVAWWPTRASPGRRMLRLPLAALAAVVALWGIHYAPVAESMAQQEAYGILEGAKTSEEVRSRLEGLAPDNKYAAFLLFYFDRKTATTASVNALLKPAQALDIDWRLNVDPADHDAVSALRTRLIDLDVALSAVPDKVPGLYQAERQAVTVKAAELELPLGYRQTVDAAMSVRQREYMAFYVLLAQLTRRAAEQFRAALDAVSSGKVTRGADGKLVYGDEATRSKVEALMAELGQTRAQLAKLAEAAPQLEQRYGGMGR